MKRTLRTMTDNSRPIALSTFLVALLVLAMATPAVQAQTQIPSEYRGSEEMIARGILDGNLIETNFRNHGELARWNDLPWGVWPRGIGGRHIDGVGIMAAGRVRAEREKWPFYNGAADTLVNPVILTYREAGKRLGPGGELWGWLPLDGFHNTRRINALGLLEPVPALSDDPSSWPAFWPDRLDNPNDPGWGGNWNGFFGRGVFNADLESFYVMDDYSDREYHVSSVTGQPNSQYGVFYPSPSDSTIGGMGLQTQVRIFQWANILAEDVMFILYRISNTSETDYRYNLEGSEGMFFTQIMDYGLGNEEGDENAAFNAREDVTFGWDQDGIGQRQDGTLYDLGYTGFAFLESPTRAEDGLDNDEDGIIDEQRFGGPGQLIEGQDAIRLYVSNNYDLINFELANGPVEETRAFKAGRWWTGDENLDWLGFDDVNGNGVMDSGESANNDVGLDGKGPFDLGYPGPDEGEANGRPDAGEPNFDELDVAESDMIGLTGFDLSSRPFYENGDNLREDTWIFDRILNFAQFPLGTPSDAFEADIEPFLLFVSGPVNLFRERVDFFSTAWVFGEDEQDFFKNRRTVQSIYDADYNFAQAPFLPTLTAIPGDGRVVLTWDTTSVASFDRFSQEFDFEGYRLYKGTNPLLTDARTITNVDGTPTLMEPIGQWDLVNDISGPVTVLENEAVYDLGDNSGLSFFYVDEDVSNGMTYYYALVAYDRGIRENGETIIDPQENIFNISVDLAGNVLGVSQNAAIVIPRSKPAGFVDGNVNEDLSSVTDGVGAGSMSVRIINGADIRSDNPYRVVFRSEEDDNPNADIQVTTSFDIVDMATSEVKVRNNALVDEPPMVDGFIVEVDNYQVASGAIEFDENQTGWVGSPGTASELVDIDPSGLDGVSTNWKAYVRADSTTLHIPTTFDYEVHWVNPADSTYRLPRFGIGFLTGSVPIFVKNTTTNQVVDLLIQDQNNNREFDEEDDVIAVDRDGFQRKFRFRISFSIPDGATSSAPDAGTVFRITPKKEFHTGDYFQFTLREPFVDAQLAEQELDDIGVVPNPYVGGSGFEQRSQISGRGERRLQFINLPQEATITIFNLRGELVDEIEHFSTSNNGSVFWDLQTRGGQDIAYGVYIYHVNAPGIGEHVGKFAVVK